MNRMFSVEYNSQAKRFLKNIDKSFAKRIIQKIEEIRENPFRYLEHYEGQGYKLRVGNFRALIDIEDRKLFVRVIDKRGRVYKR